MTYKLVQCGTGESIFVGQKCTTFRGEVVTLESWREPHRPGSSGRVYCLDDKGRVNEWFPSVIGAELIRE